LALLAPIVLLAAIGADERVRPVKLPAGALQPEAQLTSRGEIELLWFSGDPAGGDLFVASSRDGGATLEGTRRANGEKSRAIALGTVRGARLAVGRDDSLHVAWMGAAKAEPRAPGDATPLLYARAAGGGEPFSPPRNVITAAVGLNGGFDVAADGAGLVAIVWHAPARGEEGEAARRVWVASSGDDGATFRAETAVDAPRHGVCACCGMKAMFTRGGAKGSHRLWVLYRCALDGTNRDMHALVVGMGAAAYDPVRSLELSSWPANHCVMSTAALASGPADSVVLAYETRGQVRMQVSRAAGEAALATSPAGAPGDRKHPRLAVNSKGERLLCWMEGTGWEKGGTLAWQLFDREGRAFAEVAGRIEGVPAWSYGQPLALQDDRFVLFH
jgi:hypothetical protein